jgi:hypothetical protein
LRPGTLVAERGGSAAGRPHSHATVHAHGAPTKGRQRGSRAEHRRRSARSARA